MQVCDDNVHNNDDADNYCNVHNNEDNDNFFSNAVLILNLIMYGHLSDDDS